MKRILPIFVSLASAGTAFATAPVFSNSGYIITNTPIDATAIINRGTFNFNSSSFPYSTANTINFTNRGTISGSIGFQFDTVTNAVPARRPLANFFNDNGAVVSALDSGFVGSQSFVKISATNLVNHGSFSVGSVGLMQLNGQTLDLSRGSMAAGQVSDAISFNGFIFGTQYVNPVGVEDQYWGAGAVTLNFANPNFSFDPANLFTPPHLVQLRSDNGFGGTMLQTLPTTFPADFEAFANVTKFGTNVEIQVVFLKTNFVDENISAEVRFGPLPLPPTQPTGRNPYGTGAMVQFSTEELDPITGRTVTNAIYFLDSSGEQTNIVLLSNAASVNGDSRPSGYDISLSTPFGWDFAQPGNTNYDPTMIYPGDTFTDKSVTGAYGAYSAKIGRNPETLSGVSFNRFFGLSYFRFPDPTNQPGRIEINADTLDLTLSRIRTEGLLTLNAKHLKGGGAADISAGIINANLGSTNGSMVVSNIFPSHFKRVRGDLFAWSAIWSNTETNAAGTNKVTFHVLVLDHDLRADFKPTIQNLTLSSTDLVIKDDLTINKRAQFKAQNLTFEGTVTLAEDAVNFRGDNLIGVRNFLNESNAVFQGANDAFFGTDTARGYETIVNRGVISATAPSFRSTVFNNSGTIFAPEGGSVSIEAGVATLSDGEILADRDIIISAGDLVATNSMITAGQADIFGNVQFGQLVLNVTNLLTDFSTGEGGSGNYWTVTDGIILARKPFQGDLLGTEIRTIASAYQQSEHIWAGQDVGPGPQGFINNVAVGRLVLDLRSSTATLHFRGAGAQNGLYVVNLDFEAGPDVDIDTAIQKLVAIDSNLKIYYINSNAGDKLAEAFPDQVIRMDNFGIVGGAARIAVRARGLGVISPNLDGKNLNIGQVYKMKATPGAGQMFAGWSGGTNSSDAALTFAMRPNLVLEARFVQNPLDPLVGEYNGLFYNTNGVAQESSGFINFKLTKKGAVTGKLISGKTYRFSGVADPATGSATINVSRGKSATALKLTLQLDTASQSDRLTGTVTGDNWTAELSGGRAVSSPEHAGKYTLVIPGNTNSVTGDGFGTVDVDAKGHIRFKGTLADGTKVTQQVGLVQGSQWPLYVSLYKGEGSLLSWIDFSDEAETSFTGELNWIKNGDSGFSAQTIVIGSSYSAPGKGARALNIDNGQFVFGSESIAVSLANNNTISLNDGENKVKLSINPSSGLLTGSFLHHETGKTIPVKGVVLQQQNKARGFFLGAGQSGFVLLQ